MKFTRYTHTKDNRPSPTAVWLQDSGWVEGCKATDAKPGMQMLYNFSYLAEIITVAPKGKTSAQITVKTPDGQIYTSVRRGIIPAQFPR